MQISGEKSVHDLKKKKKINEFSFLIYFILKNLTISNPQTLPHNQQLHKLIL